MKSSLMIAEAAESAAVVRRQVAANRAAMRDAGARLRAASPRFAATLARGSSDQAAAFAKHLFETRCGVPTLSHSPSVGALYHATSPLFAGQPLLAISQSGRSPDLVAAAEEAKARGALVVVIVNDVASPLAQLADVLLPLHAGEERSVAATKTFVASLVAVAHLAACWGEDAALLTAVERAGDMLTQAAVLDWSAAEAPIAAAETLLVLGRGPTLPIAGEAALKLKETSGIHAEAFSAAEVAHGPMALVARDAPLLAFVPRDAAAAGFAERLAGFAERGARVIAAGAPASITLPVVDEPEPAMAAVAQIARFHALAEAVARRRGRDPDHPPSLRKVTETL